ncbi:hypothetical protein [Phenylobacterium sp.]|uniref:hypothetical protein n=1 Tax=Phenylobacterium sp. TaxID=1871053 RepID=UPI002FCC5E5B
MKESVLQLLAGIGLMIGTAILAATAGQSGILNSAMASWVQGLGTLGAIFAAIYAGQVPLRIDRDRRRDEHREFVTAVIDAAQYLDLQVERLRPHVAGRYADELAKDFTAHNHSRGRDAMDKLLDEPLTKWPSHILYIRTLKLTDTWITLFSTVNGYEKHAREDGGQMRDIAFHRIEAALAEYGKAEQAFKQSIAGLRLPD